MATKIEWAQNVDGTAGETWNAIRGCSKISPGCEHCYAMHVAARFSGPDQPYQGLAKRNPTNWTGEVRLVEDKLYEPLRRRKPTTYFVNSMSDLFHEKVEDAWIDRIFAVMALCQRHTFQVLTKRAERLPEYVTEAAQRRVYKAIEAIGFPPVASSYGGISKWPLDNVWLGVSVENQDMADERIPHLIQTPAAVRFLSCEPLLGPINLHRALCTHFNPDRPEQQFSSWCTPSNTVGWVIVGGESAQGSKCRICDVRWISSIVEDCQAAKVPVFVKQVGSRPYKSADEFTLHIHGRKDSKGGDPAEWPEDLRVRQFPRAMEAVS